jgi:hypothetical protein
MFPQARVSGDWATGLDWHRTAKVVGLMIKQGYADLEVSSERTGLPIAATPRRLRSTFGTRAAAEGHSAIEIAEMLDHTDTQNVQVYVEARPEFIENLDAKIALHLAPFAQAFAGVLIDRPSKHEPRENVVTEASPNGNGLGNCGSHAFCGLAAPIACYTCRQFRPWRDGPHKAVLEGLIQERERLMETTDQRIASVRDRTIVAVADVVRQCDGPQFDEVSDE